MEFNAHRVFYAQTVLECFSELHLIEFSCTTEAGIEHNVDIHAYDNDGHNGEYRYYLPNPKCSIEHKADILSILSSSI